MSLPDPATIAAQSHLLPLLRAAMQAIGQGDLSGAETQLDDLLARQPGFADGLHLKGYIALQRGDLPLARDLVERAIAADYHFENYHLTLGHILLAQGEREAAKQSFGAALTLNPKMIEAYIGLGQIFLDEDELDGAVGVLNTAVGMALKHPEANYMLGYAYMAKGEAVKAMSFFHRAYQFIPDNQRYRIGFARSLRDLRLMKPEPALLKAALTMLGTPGVEPRDLTNIIEGAIKLDPVFRALASIDIKPPASIAGLLAMPNCPDPLATPGFAEWLQHGLVMDPAIERRLPALRRGLLSMALQQPEHLPRYSRLLALLAIRAFQSEYLDAVTHPKEVPLIGELERKLVDADPATAADFFAVYALYAPLYRRADAERLDAAAWPTAFAGLKQRQLSEPLAERRIAATLPTLVPIEDQTSRSVQEMYEESPFPRWHQPVLGNPLSLPAHLRAALPLQAITTPAPAQADVLIAGCGTGLQAILAATSYDKAQVLAIDLSRTSLAYAKRKADELRIDNITFAQADILKLGGIGRQFDVIESFGVLHHLRDPAAGLAQLVSLLKPDGYMMLGLYSEIGRRDVVAARDLIAKHGYGDGPDEVRRFRLDLPRLNPALANRLAQSSAWYTLSDLRDLVFHRQEHRYTPQQLRQMIDAAGMEFLGFVFTSPQPLTSYRKRFPADTAGTNLDNWAAFEIDNPDLFANCYRFWLRKKR